MGRGQVAEKAVPKTIPERKVVKFKPAKQLKAVVAGV
jgi:nucleoid DNA-binding protein